MVIMFIISLGFKGVFDRREGEIFLLGRGRLLQGEVVPPLIVLRRGLTSPYRPFCTPLGTLSLKSLVTIQGRAEDFAREVCEAPQKVHPSPPTKIYLPL